MIDRKKYVEEDRGYKTPCWIWQGWMSRRGYGMVGWSGGGNRRSQVAHRWTYELAKGPIPTGLVVDHLCSVKACVNPDHLEAVTQAVNVQRGRATRITYEQVEEIREVGKALADHYGISQSYVGRLMAGAGWGNRMRKENSSCTR